MARLPRLPAHLLHGPFTLDEARKAGLQRWHLEGASWKRIGPASYIAARLADDPMHRLAEAHRRLPLGSVFSGLTAAWLHGLDVVPCAPIEATVPPGAGVSMRSGIALRRATLAMDDVARARGLPVTTVVRTLAELCGRLQLSEAVAVVDAALHARRIKLPVLAAWAKSHGGRPGVRALRQVLEHAEPAAESMMESRLRMVLVLGGLPRPTAQVSIHDRWGRFIGRPDLYYEEARLGIEYDGSHHRETLADDNRRQNKLLHAGVRLLRFTAGDVLGDPAAVVAHVGLLLQDRSGHSPRLPATAANDATPGPPLPAPAAYRGWTGLPRPPREPG